MTYTVTAMMTAKASICIQSSVTFAMIFVGVGKLKSPAATAFWEKPTRCLSTPFEALQEAKSPEFPLDMSGMLCYILPVCQAFKPPKVSCPREAEATGEQRDEDIEFHNYATQHGYLTDDKMTGEFGHQLLNISYSGLHPRYRAQMVKRFMTTLASRQPAVPPESVISSP
jgi:hypothetical protein